MYDVFFSLNLVFLRSREVIEHKHIIEEINIGQSLSPWLCTQILTDLVTNWIQSVYRPSRFCLRLKLPVS